MDIYNLIIISFENEFGLRTILLDPPKKTRFLFIAYNAPHNGPYIASHNLEVIRTTVKSTQSMNISRQFFNDLRFLLMIQ
jgi:hypothetical protein